MKISVFILFSLLSAEAYSMGTNLVCANLEEGHKRQELRIWRADSLLESHGEVTRRPYYFVNLICNDATALIGLKKNILCVGVDRTPTDLEPVVIQEEIVFTASGYKWRGFDCN